MNGFVVAANAAVWIALAAYAVALCLRSRSISKRLQQLETLRDGHDG